MKLDGKSGASVASLFSFAITPSAIWILRENCRTKLAKKMRGKLSGRRLRHRNLSVPAAQP
ncbi:MAG TPA: hypothetical protein VGO57_14540 [Verrucomicrobiae bacterium]